MYDARNLIETQYPNARILRWNEWDEDAGNCMYEGWIAGRMVRADTLALFISAIQEWDQRPLLLAA